MGATAAINWTNSAANTAGLLTFGANQECDKNWKVPVITTPPVEGVTTTPNRSYGCYGMAKPYGYTIKNQFKAASGSDPQLNGYTRAWKWLAELGADKSKVFSLEINDKVNIMLYEMVDKTPNMGTSPTSWNPAVYKWQTAQVSVTYANTMTFSTSVITALLLLYF